MRESILKHCDPKKIAEELIRELEAKAVKMAKSGGRQVTVKYKLWSNFGGSRKGPLANMGEFFEVRPLADTLRDMIPEFIQNENIELAIETSYCELTISRDIDIHARLSW